MNPLRELTKYGQAVWLDDLHRDLVAGGELNRMIEEDWLSGLTSNPAIFQKSISNGSAYEEDIRQLKDKRLAAEEIFTAIAVHDMQMAADAFRPLYDRTGGEQGYVSLEVSPHFARHTKPTIEEARRLWWAVARPNIFIKIPATHEGLPAIEQLLSEGINVNVTLLFGLRRYGEVANAFIAGVEKRRRSGESIENLRSVASFFLSRIDVMVDPELEALIRLGGERGKLAEPIRGEVAIACAKVAYQMHKQIFAGDRWSRLAEKGGQSQRLLWASTGTKNPDYSDVKYVEPLIGPDTVNTMPMKTLEAYREQGRPEARLEQDVEHARRVLSQLPRLDIDLDEISGRLEDEGITKFQKPFDELLKTLEEELQAA